MTKGEFQVETVNPAPGYTAEEVLAWAAQAERFSNHPIAQSIVAAANDDANGSTNNNVNGNVNGDDGGSKTESIIEAYEEIAGLGIKAVSAGRTVLVGNSKLMQQEGVQGFQDGGQNPGTTLHVAVDQCYAGSLQIADQLKEDSVDAVRRMKELGVRKLVMLTGDSKDAAAQVAAQLQVDDYYAELLPQDKVAHMERLYLYKGKGSMIFIGDGINDAPVLARADIGVAMGGLGSDAAIEAADVVIMTDEPSKLATAMQIAGRTKQVVWQNIILALTVKGVVLALGAAGFATMWEAVFADVGVALLAVFNTLRVLRN